MLVARRPMSIGNVVFNTGDRITREAQDQLPPGRMPQLLSHGWVEELVDEVALERRVEQLEQQVDDLRAQLARTGIKAAAPKKRRTSQPDEADGDESGEVPAAPAEAPPAEESPPPAEAEPEPEPPAEPEPTPAKAPEVPAKVWDPIDACWKSEDELIAATEARARQRRRTKAVK